MDWPLFLVLAVMLAWIAFSLVALETEVREVIELEEHAYAEIEREMAVAATWEELLARLEQGTL